MKKTTLVAIFTFCALLVEGQISFNQLPVEMKPDMKYWFSETQFQNSIELAIRTKRTVRRCYIDGIQFTEQGYTRNSGSPKDSRLVARIYGSDTDEHIIRCVFTHPDDIKNVILKAQFAKF